MEIIKKIALIIQKSRKELSRNQRKKKVSGKKMEKRK
jgi:hypothetical protein